MFFAIPAVAVMAGGIVTRIFASSIIRFLAIKLLAWTGLTVVLPIVMWKVWMKVQTYALEKVMEGIAGYAGSVNPAVIELTGIGAYMADHLLIAEGISVLLGGALVAYSIRLMKR